MNNLEIAKKILYEEGLTIALVKNGECFFKSKKRGIKPLFTAIKNHKKEMKGASGADKIVGKGAALLYIYGEIEELYSHVISESSLEVIKENKIKYQTDLIVPYIKNKDMTGMCPIETLAVEDSEINSLLKRIEEFLNKK